jgi:hypothetical protein
VTERTPRRGGKVVLELARASAAGVVYRAALLEADAEWRAEATVDGAGVVGFGAWTPAEPPVPAWLVDHARTFLRTEWRARQGEDPPPWPARLSRWRGR